VTALIEGPLPGEAGAVVKIMEDEKTVLSSVTLPFGATTKSRISPALSVGVRE
jgi:hypothetical protein